MPTYASLNPADKAIVDNTTNLVRGAAGEMARIWNRIKAITDDTNATNLVVSLDAGQVIPNTSGLAGADDLTREQLITVFNLLANIRSHATNGDTPANREAMSRAAGINAMMQG